jgi:wyosine [tRNA(Phe)-imidazoG37] synthetase (radical SAM superfamily)
MTMNKDPHTDVSDIIYGPVKSRRHGLSLGLNVGVADKKICTWSCLYCQCGFGERRDFVGTDNRFNAKVILSALESAIKEHPSLDAVTLAGNTEPGTHPEIEPIIKGMLELRRKYDQHWKIIILSNGSELDRQDVVRAFSLADETWLKLDVGSEELFKTLNRPMAKIGSLDNYIERISSFKNLRIQTLLWVDASNSKLGNFHQDNLDKLYCQFKKIKPVAINITTISRIPAMPQLQAIDYNSALFVDFYKKIRELQIPVSYA